MSKKNGERRRRRSFTEEFKADAVRHYQAGDRSIGQIARDLDLTETALRSWVRKAEEQATPSSSELTNEERDELKQLRKRVRELEMDREILKKAHWAQPVNATPSLSSSAGERKPNVFRGRWFSRSAILFRSACEQLDRSVPFGKYCRRRRFVFSFVPRCQGLCGSQK